MNYLEGMKLYSDRGHQRGLSVPSRMLRTFAIAPRWMLMLVLTGIYLTIEVPFSAHLLDVLGANPTLAEIEDIEVFGRWLTGFAVAIIAFGLVLDISRDRFRASRAASLVAAIAISLLTAVATFHALNHVADRIGGSSTAEERRDAFHALLARRALSDGIGAPVGYPDRSQFAGTPEWKAFVAIVPAVGSGRGILDGMGIDRDPLVLAEARRRLGDVEDMRTSFFRDTFHPFVGDAFLRYEYGVMDYRDGLARISERCEFEWRSYMRRRDRAGMGAGRQLSQRQRQAIRTEVRRAGAPVSNSWHPNDREGFCEAVGRDARQSARRAYREGISNAVGSGEEIPMGLDYATFIESPAVQAVIRSELGIGGSGLIRPSMTTADFERIMFAEIMERTIADLRRMADAPVDAFGPGGEFEVEGELAAKAIHIPPMAVALSVAGAAFHLIKFSYLSLGVVNLLLMAASTRIRPAPGICKLGGVAITVAFGAYLASGSTVLSSSDTVTEWAAARAGIGDRIGGEVLDYTVRVQHGFHPVGVWLTDRGAYRLIGGMPPVMSANLGEPTVSDPPRIEGTPTPGVPIPTFRPAA